MATRLTEWKTPHRWNREVIDKSVAWFETQINKSLKVACPKRFSSFSSKRPKWWSPELQALRSKMRELDKKRAFPEKREEYKKVRNEYKRTLRKAKKETWKQWTSSTDSAQEMSKLIRSLNKSNDKSLGLLKNSQGQYVDNPEDTVSILMQRFFPNHNLESDDTNRQECCTVRNSQLNQCIHC